MSLRSNLKSELQRHLFHVHALGVTAVLMLTATVSAQPYPAWFEMWSGLDAVEDIGWDVDTDSEGNIIVGGWTTVDDMGHDGLLIKYDRSGRLLWQQTYEGTGNGNDYLGEIKIDSNDNILLHGCSEGVGTDYDFLTLKYASDGTLLWEQRFDGTGSGVDWSGGFGAIDLDAADNVYITGYSLGTSGDHEFMTIKYAADGTQEWVQTYVSPNPDNPGAYGWFLEVTDDGTVYAGGDAMNLAGSRDYVLLKYDTNGTLLWDRLYDGPAGVSDTQYAMKIGPNEDVYLTGIIGTRTGYEYGVAKYDSNGVFQWDAQYGGSTGFHYGWAIDVDAAGNAFVTGASMSSGGQYDWATVCFDTNGTQQWAQRFSDPSYFGADWAYDVHVDSYGDIYVCGYIWSWFAEGNNAAVVKYDVNGNTLWEDVYNGIAGGDDAWFQMFVDESDQVLLTGTSLGLGTGADLTLAKFRQGGPSTLVVTPMPLVSGETGTFTVSNVEPNADTYLVYSTTGEGSIQVPFLNVTLGILAPQQAGSTISADASGTAVWNLPIPDPAAGLDVWFQGAQYNVVTDVVATTVE